MTGNAFGVALADAMADHGTTTADGGRMAGVSPSMVSHWTTGRNVPYPDQVFAIEKGLGLPPGQLSRHRGYVPNTATDFPPWTVSEALRADPALARHPVLQELFLYDYRTLARLAVDGED